MNIREVAEAALADILTKPKGSVYASRRGIVAGSIKTGRNAVLFRRADGVVRLELSPRGSSGIKDFILPADIAARAGEMLDNL